MKIKNMKRTCAIALLTALLASGLSARELTDNAGRKVSVSRQGEFVLYDEPDRHHYFVCAESRQARRLGIRPRRYRQEITSSRNTTDCPCSGSGPEKAERATSSKS